MTKRPQPVNAAVLPPQSNHSGDIKSDDLNMFDDDLEANQFDFKHNIIFKEPEEDNITLEEDASDSKQSTPAQVIKKDNSLGEIVTKPANKLKVESKMVDQEESP